MFEYNNQEETIFEKIKDFIEYKIINKIKSIPHKIRNIRAKSHILYHPDFKISDYYEIDEKLLYCCFQALIDFIEIEKSLDEHK